MDKENHIAGHAAVLGRAADLLGSSAAIARVCGVSKGAVWQWSLPGRRVPAEHCPTIEKATLGLVRCEELRPDVDWDYLRNRPRKRRAKD